MKDASIKYINNIWKSNTNILDFLFEEDSKTTYIKSLNKIPKQINNKQ